MSESYGQLQGTISLSNESLLEEPRPSGTADTGPYRSYPYYHPVMAGVTTSMDAFGVLGATVLCAHVEPTILMENWHVALPLADLMSALGFLMIPKKRSLLYIPDILQVSAQVRYLARPLVIGALLHFIVLYMLHRPTAQAIELSLVWIGICAATLAVLRGGEILILHHPSVTRHLARNIAVIGSDEVALKVAARVTEEAGPTYRMVGVFDDHDTALDPTVTDGTLDDLIVRSRESRLHAIILAIPPSSDPVDHVAEISWRLRSVLSDVYVMPNLVHGIDVLLPIERLGPFALLVLQRRPLSDWQIVRKTMLDVVAGAIALALLTPLMCMIAIAIKATSPGPVFFRQPRLGYNNRNFMVFKFRTMHANMSDMMAAKQTSRDDPRVTRIGKWLRKLSLDELPQLLNVLRGEMSLVGPRPHAPHTRADGMLLDDALAEYVIRHQVKPGITGWAQVNGARGELVTLDDLRRRVEYDLEYMQKWSLRFDLKILALTVLREVFSKHAF
ncbi:exopolysaccharide biosynthesis polyprenyl glycosylphosphotransferase [Gluconacetobacter tumulisoli]|uniref:Exopolysaccharide biosynthesis polyprenyl glycosylphosphotransferase n=1 Tax=Gluconacetobacter tumulisoli TaxID=1286189 RepID=A0A7W4K5V3_9PROT|nr:exopolysaccharide biosynthesis polyprenyl glycosylphosphotransferase [Gluconacetobacter tumulisoli]MBB2200954.1 exopolysaccharide biosynthesis polyprenyl glycosylphosphotransferase [Gluconacetobacter tumulisoli]